MSWYRYPVVTGRVVVASLLIVVFLFVIFSNVSILSIEAGQSSEYASCLFQEAQGGFLVSLLLEKTSATSAPVLP